MGEVPHDSRPQGKITMQLLTLDANRAFGSKPGIHKRKCVRTRMGHKVEIEGLGSLVGQRIERLGRGAIEEGESWNLWFSERQSIQAGHVRACA